MLLVSVHDHGPSHKWDDVGGKAPHVTKQFASQQATHWLLPCIPCPEGALMTLLSAILCVVPPLAAFTTVHISVNGPVKKHSKTNQKVM